MGSYLFRRSIQGIFTLIFVSMILFLGLRASGDPAAMLAPIDAPAADVAKLRESLGLDEPVYIQYWRFWEQSLTGELQSFRFKQSTLSLVGPFLVRTAQLVLPAVLISSILGIILGVVAAFREGSWLDSLILVTTLAGQVVPYFFLALLFILLFSVHLRWTPVSGTGSISHYVLPVGTIALYNLSILVRLTRSSMIEILSEDYIRTARAKGLSNVTVLLRHGLRSASLEIVSAIGLQLGVLLSGVVVTETIFAWPGIGKLMYDAVLQRDFPLVMTGTLILASIIIVVNLLVDLMYAMLDPRIRLD